MKTLLLLLLSSCCYAQQYDAESLGTMNKLELSKIYLDKLNQVSKLLPMMAFTIKFEGEPDTYDGVIEIPNTKQNKTALDRVTIENNNVWCYTKEAIVSTKVDAEYKCLFNHKCFCGVPNRLFCIARVSGSLLFRN